MKFRELVIVRSALLIEVLDQYYYFWNRLYDECAFVEVFAPDGGLHRERQVLPPTTILQWNSLKRCLEKWRHLTAFAKLLRSGGKILREKIIFCGINHSKDESLEIY